MCYNLIMSNIKLSHLFSIPLMEFEYGQISEDENKIINHYLNDLRPNVYNFTTRESYILDKEKGLSNLKKFIYRAIYTYVKSVIVGDEYNQDELNFKITQSWANLTQPDSVGHHQHTHSNSVISGVLYVQTNDDDSVTFANDYLASTTIKTQVKVYNQFNSDSWRFPVNAGKLLLFPSNLPHQVESVKGNEDRISLSFNVFPYGILGSRDELSELRILEDK